MAKRDGRHPAGKKSPRRPGVAWLEFSRRREADAALIAHRPVAGEGLQMGVALCERGLGNHLLGPE